MDRHVHMDDLITRARMLILYVSDVEAAKIMMIKGIDRGDVFLAIKAAEILNRSR